MLDRFVLLRRNAGILDDVAPSVDFTLEKGFERCGRRAFLLDRRHAEFSEAVDQRVCINCKSETHPLSVLPMVLCNNDFV